MNDKDIGMFHKVRIAKEFNTTGSLPLSIKWNGNDFANHTVEMRKK